MTSCPPLIARALINRALIFSFLESTFEHTLKDRIFVTMSETYTIGSRSESERLVRDWGFRHVFTWADGRYVQPQEFAKYGLY